MFNSYNEMGTSEKEVFEFLDDIKESGEEDMLKNGPPQIQKDFGVSRGMSIDWFQSWAYQYGFVNGYME